ncbi:hypothetical protein RM530_18515, partial [Algiphilus sp. W345]
GGLRQGARPDPDLMTPTLLSVKVKPFGRPAADLDAQQQLEKLRLIRKRSNRSAVAPTLNV